MRIAVSDMFFPLLVMLWYCMYPEHGVASVSFLTSYSKLTHRTVGLIGVGGKDRTGDRIAVIF